MNVEYGKGRMRVGGDEVGAVRSFIRRAWRVDFVVSLLILGRALPGFSISSDYFSFGGRASEGYDTAYIDSVSPDLVISESAISEVIISESGKTESGISESGSSEAGISEAGISEVKSWEGCGSRSRSRKWGGGRWLVGVDVAPAYLFSSFKDDVVSEMLNSDRAAVSHFSAAVHLKYGFILSREDSVGRRFPNVRQGIGVGANIFTYPKSTGVPGSVYLFQGAPIVRLSPAVSLDYEWNFGASFGWKPCDGKVAQSNIIVASRVNAYINLWFGIRWRLNRDVDLTGGLDLTHFSNGNTSFPNPGVNLAGVRLGINRYFGEEEAAGTPFDRGKCGEGFHISYDLTAYGAWRKRVYRGGETPVLLPGAYGIAGLTFSPLWDITQCFRAGLSADFQWDESSDLRRNYISGTTTDDIRFSRPSFFRQVSGGISARGELVMPYFSVNLGIGYNIIGPEEARASYQMANLKIFLTRAFYLNIGYQLQNFQKQSNLMLGVGYSFRSMRIR